MSTDPNAPSSQHGHRPKESIQDTIISVVIAFTLAFVFRGFVVEAFVIPTGSMAPTLMGANERVRSSESGNTWPVGPWYSYTLGQQDYKPVQGDAKDGPIVVHDPLTGAEITKSNVPRKSGDRILVLKYLYMVMEPERFDVVVFKCPYEPQTNFIKRLVGLPGEEVALVDGDVFVRPARDPVERLSPVDGKVRNPWADSDWKIARKPPMVQSAVWQCVFDSSYALRGSIAGSDETYSSPWASKDAGWKIEGRSYEYSGTASTKLEWDSKRLRFRTRLPAPYPSFSDYWEINDRYAYNESPMTAFQRNVYRNTREVLDYFPVSDIRMSAGIKAQNAGLKALATISARSHEFQMEIADETVQLRMRRLDRPEWTTLAEESVAAIQPGRVVNVEFTHADQALSVTIDGEKVASAPYEWGPDERIRMATQRTLDDLLKSENGNGLDGDPVSGRNIFEDREIYQKPGVSWSFEGSPVTLYRVKIDRDLYYQPGRIPADQTPSRGSSPKSPVLLNGDQFFVCGDNSPASHDGRMWSAPDPWVRQIDGTWGVVPRKLMLGKAFFVYYPAPTWVGGKLPVPDFGRMRFIW